jgi:hypothetical protein
VYLEGLLSSGICPSQNGKVFQNAELRTSILLFKMLCLFIKNKKAKE